MNVQQTRSRELSRRGFLKGTAAVAALAAGADISRLAYAAGAQSLRVGVIGCGGRGTGAAMNALEASPAARIAALADMFPDRIASSRRYLSEHGGERARVEEEHCHTGFDAYARLLEGARPDVVILAAPPHFRPAHAAAAMAAGCHVFMEKPVAVDPAGVRAILAAADQADSRGLCIVAGTQRRHERSYLEALSRIRDGALGRIIAARCAWNMGGLWMHPRKPEWTDMEWQLRNWLYFTWLSGDHIVEQHVHNLDVVNWALGTHPIRAAGNGGRQVRTDPAYGNVFDHFAVEFEYPGGVLCTSMCRQTDGCASRVDESLCGEQGSALLRPGFARLDGPRAWSFAGENPNPYVQEHRHLFAAIAAAEPVNEARGVAESTLTAIMGRMAAYTGQEVTWDQALNSKLDLTPPAYELGPLPTPDVAMPGKTALP